MASLTLITIAVLAINTCYGEIHLSPNLYTEAHLAQHHGSRVVYVPAHIGNLPLQDHGQTYHAHLDVGAHQTLHSDIQSQYQSLNTHTQQDQHLQHLGGEHHSGSATVYQQSDHHSSEQKQEIHHHGSGVSHQVFKQEHDQHDLGSQVHDFEHDNSDEYHKKNHNVNYQFEYSVNDHKTGDVKRHKEERKGDVVNGEYSLLEEDGNVRTVKYYADWKTGFHAQIHNSKTKSVG